MIYFSQRKPKLLPKVHTELRLLLVLVWVTLCFGCAMKPSVSLEDLHTSSQIKRHPLRVVVAFTQKFQSAVFKGSFARHISSSTKIGKSSVEFFKKSLPLLFQEVEFVTEDVTLKDNQILIIPEITTAYSQLKSSNSNMETCVIEYRLSFYNPAHKMLFQTSANGSGLYNGTKAGVIGGLTVFVGAPGLPAAVELAKAFGEAEAQAMNKLMDNIISSPVLLAYADGNKRKVVEHKPQKGRQKIAKSQYPPKLICKVSFSEPSGNYILDANEKGKILVTIENKGKGDANFININLNTIEPVKGLSYKKSLKIKTIPTGKSIRKEIYLTADKTITTSQVKFKVQATTEISGVESEPVIVVFQTKKFRLPEINNISDFAKQKKIAPSHTNSAKALFMPLPISSSFTNSKKWAVIVGISQYLHSGRNGLTNLIFADDDAKAFVSTLRKFGWSESHIKVLINEKATERNIKIALKSWLTKAGPDDQVILFWAGHGYPDPEASEKVYLATYDTDISIPVTGYRMDEVRKALEEIGSKNVILLADTCHAGKLITRGDGRRGISIVPNIKKMTREQKVPKGWVYMVGADTDRQAIEHTSWTNGAFTHSLISS